MSSVPGTEYSYFVIESIMPSNIVLASVPYRSYLSILLLLLLFQ